MHRAPGWKGIARPTDQSMLFSVLDEAIWSLLIDKLLDRVMESRGRGENGEIAESGSAFPRRHQIAPPAKNVRASQAQPRSLARRAVASGMFRASARTILCSHAPTPKLMRGLRNKGDLQLPNIQIL